MKGKQKIPRYAVRLVVLILMAGFAFFGRLRLFITEDWKGQINTLIIFKYLIPAHDIRPAIMLAVNNWRNYRKAIFRRNAL